MKHLKSDKGVTLVELLAALGLFSIVIVLASSLIMQFAKGEEQTSEKVSLQQEANVLISDLRNQYYAADTELCFQQNNKLGISASQGEKELEIQDNCIKADPEKPVSVTVSPLNETNPLIKTTWENKKKNYTVTVERGDDDGEDDEFEEGKIDECSFEENVFFPESQKLHTGNKNFCEEYNFYKNAAFLDGLVVQPHLEVTVHGNLYVDGFLEVKNKSEVIIEKDLYITGDITVKGQGSLEVKGTIYRVDDLDDVEGIPDMED